MSGSDDRRPGLDESRVIELARLFHAHPELGFFETETRKILAGELASCGARMLRDDPCGGIVAETGSSDSGAPTIYLVADLDALPVQGIQGGVAHACGHHAQMAVCVSVFAALARSDLPHTEGLRIVFVGSPAEEFVDLGRRRELRERGLVRYLSGKQEQIRLGVFDAPGVILKYHAMADPPAAESAHPFLATVNGPMNGFVALRAVYEGKAAHAGGAPHDGVNALSAAMLGLAAINAQRETFRDQDHIRVHPILTEGGTAVNSVPDRAVAETYVRGAHAEAIASAAEKVRRAFASGALALGARLTLESTPGYQPFIPDPVLGGVLSEAARTFIPASRIDFESEDFASDDIGDVACLLPTCQLRAGGFSGTRHGADFLASDPGIAYVLPARILLETAVLLCRSNGERARKVIAGFSPRMSKTDYISMLESSFSSLSFSARDAGFPGI